MLEVTNLPIQLQMLRHYLGKCKKWFSTQVNSNCN